MIGKMGNAAEGVKEDEERPPVETEARHETIQHTFLPRPTFQGAVVSGKTYYFI